MILEDLNKIIEAENETFNNLSKAKKRVQIAKDCINRIKLQQLIPSKGKILDLNEDITKYGEDLKTVFNTSQISCEVCAKGGLFLSYVGRTNKVKTSLLNTGGNDFNSIHHVKLLEIFSHEQIAIIETAFEGCQYLNGYTDKKGDWVSIDLSNELNCKINDFSWTHTNSNERLLAICKNIIKNRGTFQL